MTDSRPRIVVIGGNFAGLTAAIRLSRRHAVTVIDPGDYFEWVPNIHEIVSSVKTPQALRLDRRAIVERAGHRFVQDRVIALQPAKRRLTTAGGTTLDYDACIVAVGAVWNTHRVPGVAQHALPFRGIADALAVEQRLQALVKAGDSLRLVIAGGGIVGIEALGEILRRHRDAPGLHVEVVEAAGRLLPAAPAAIDADLRALCEPWPVTFRVGTAIERVTPKGVVLAGGKRLRSALTLWTAGLAPPELLLASGLAPAPQSWARVRQTLQSRHFDTCFVVGDAAVLPRPIAKQAYHAIDMGEVAADNAARLLAGRPLVPFEPAAKPTLIAFGDLQTYLVAGRTVLASQMLAGAKEGVYQLFMARIAPCDVLTSLPAATGRLWRSWRRLALPQLLTLAEFRKLPDLRVLGRPGGSTGGGSGRAGG